MTSETIRIGSAEYGGAFTVEGAGALGFVLPGELVSAEPLVILEASKDRVAPKSNSTICPVLGLNR